MQYTLSQEMILKSMISTLLMEGIWRTSWYSKINILDSCSCNRRFSNILPSTVPKSIGMRWNNGFLEGLGALQQDWPSLCVFFLCVCHAQQASSWSIQIYPHSRKDPKRYDKWWNTLPKFNSPLRNDGWKTTFLLGWYIFRGYVKLPGGDIIEFF